MIFQNFLALSLSLQWWPYPYSFVHIDLFKTERNSSCWSNTIRISLQFALNSVNLHFSQPNKNYDDISFKYRIILFTLFCIKKCVELHKFLWKIFKWVNRNQIDLPIKCAEMQGFWHFVGSTTSKFKGFYVHMSGPITCWSLFTYNT